MGPGMAAFVRESNLIEGIDDPEADRIHAEALGELMSWEELRAGDLFRFTKAIQPLAHGWTNGLRIRPGMNVRVGGHVPPAGGPEIAEMLGHVLEAATRNLASPYVVHTRYETLHPFMDGNGRSGRALWAWQMATFHGYVFQRTFLHLWYYQSLDARRS